MIPHDTGIMTSTKLNSEKIIQQKCSLLDGLLDVEKAMKVLSSVDSTKQENVFDQHYAKLEREIKPLSKENDKSGIYKAIEKSLKGTHCATHDNYTLELEEVFELEKKKETKQFKPYKKKLEKNIQLLWHGSRMVNFAGILSSGLRIAPPEAPVTGYMFGKGLYFADCISKSANYCYHEKYDNTGFLMLCEVALGEF